MKSQKIPFLLFGILLIGALFRGLWLTGVPNGLNRDEIVMGYDAFCILKTGKDQWGQWLPFFFRGLDGYQPGIFPYTTMLWVWLLGNTDTAIRLTPFFYGMLTLITTFFLTKRLFNQNKEIALITVFLLAIAPWHIHYSRFGNPNILVPFFHTLALLLFFKGVDQQKKYWLLAALIFGLSFHSYYVTYLFIPLSLLGLLLIFWKELWCNKKIAFFSLLILAIFLLPHAYHILFGNILNRSNILIFAQTNNTFLENLNHFFKNYLSFFSLQFLFAKGYMTGGEWFGRHGMLYWFELPLLVIGILTILFRPTKKKLFLLWWLLIYPIPASLTADQHNLALRSSIALPVFQIISGLGAWQLFAFIWNLKLKPTWHLWIKRSSVLLFCLALLFCIQRFNRKYFVKYPRNYAKEAQYGMKQMCNFIRDKINDYDQIVVTGHISDTARRRPLLFLAYYLPIDPAQYQTLPKTLVYESIVSAFDKFQVNYRDNLKLLPKPGEKVLYIVKEEECEGAKVLKRIYYPNKDVVYKICVFQPAPEVNGHK